MIRILGILAIAFLIGTKSYSQNADLENLPPTIKDAIVTLQSKGIDTIMVYHSYCIGCETLGTTKECEGFGSARILWKKNGKDFSQRVYCSKAPSEVSETNSLAFKYFLENRQTLSERKPIAKGKFYPPLTVHYFGEEFYLSIGKKWYFTKLHDDQKESKEWKRFSWILPTLRLQS